MRRPWPVLGRSATEKKSGYYIYQLLYICERLPIGWCARYRNGAIFHKIICYCVRYTFVTVFVIHLLLCSLYICYFVRYTFVTVFVIHLLLSSLYTCYCVRYAFVTFFVIHLLLCSLYICYFVRYTFVTFFVIHLLL